MTAMIIDRMCVRIASTHTACPRQAASDGERGRDGEGVGCGERERIADPERPQGYGQKRGLESRREAACGGQRRRNCSGLCHGHPSSNGAHPPAVRCAPVRRRLQEVFSYREVLALPRTFLVVCCHRRSRSGFPAVAPMVFNSPISCGV